MSSDLIGLEQNIRGTHCLDSIQKIRESYIDELNFYMNVLPVLSLNINVFGVFERGQRIL